jgi:hypothetical protein
LQLVYEGPGVNTSHKGKTEDRTGRQSQDVRTPRAVQATSGALAPILKNFKDAARTRQSCAAVAVALRCFNQGS